MKRMLKVRQPQKHYNEEETVETFDRIFEKFIVLLPPAYVVPGGYPISIP